MKTLYLLCGMPFSGKTTLGKSIAQHLSCPYISLDEINEAKGLFGGDGIPVEEWEKTHFLAMEQLPSLMESGQNIVVDDTSCFRWLRERFIDFVKPYDYQTVIVFLDIPLSVIKKRMKQNEETKARHRVKQNIIEEMAKTFEPPQADENVVRYSVNQSIDEWIAKHFVTNLD
ncbi:MAG: ATP-binding protein [Hyellaceae cyanobacterium CSU_1_1]|nr:ATP-binding protein [Hyellaceae cyanobacterium CSU_1_1]